MLRTLQDVGDFDKIYSKPKRLPEQRGVNVEVSLPPRDTLFEVRIYRLRGAVQVDSAVVAKYLRRLTFPTCTVHQGTVAPPQALR